jgi:hypothetical protein
MAWLLYVRKRLKKNVMRLFWINIVFLYCYELMKKAKNQKSKIHILI